MGPFMLQTPSGPRLRLDFSWTHILALLPALPYLASAIPLLAFIENALSIDHLHENPHLRLLLRGTLPKSVGKRGNSNQGIVMSKGGRHGYLMNAGSLPNGFLLHKQRTAPG